MNDKTVTMNYVEHEKMIKEFKELKDAKFCVLDINIHSYSSYHYIESGKPFRYFKYMISSEQELREKIASVIKGFEHEILMPYREKITIYETKINEMNSQIEFLKSELVKAREQKSWKFWK